MSIITASVAVVNLSIGRNRHGLRAPKGGCTVNGKVYKGGQFCLPYDPTDPHGKPIPAKVAILGFTYTVREIPAGECGTVAYRMHRIDTNNTYDVIRNHFGEVTCDCPDYEMRRANTGTMCKHGRRLVELGMVPTPRPTPSVVRVAAMAGRSGKAPAPESKPLRPAPQDDQARPIEGRDSRPRRHEPTPEDWKAACEMFRDSRDR